ncbi:PA3496 family putative envelope integrity protein [Thalassotalea mangrovi]|uniref:Uncharacterized protein n=1 Tax=Thalassotalea mangrovi TaxID=2572245 RepID=A0A4U1B8B6_9GAMM|nr:hypothetical protein [Thalassotalea mangrovi]TKB46893.1 hypothetical protein E8M12_02830 [Thalassotalea mangrovi]
MTGNEMNDDDFDDGADFEPDATDTDLPKSDNQVSKRTRKRIDELLEKKRLKELLDEDDWEL